MPSPEVKPKHHPKPAKDSALKGTFAAVIILGAIIIITWASVYFLYTGRL